MCSLQFESEKRIDTDGIGRYKLLEFKYRRLARFCACFEQIGHLRFGETSGKADHHTVVLTSGMNSTEHDARTTQKVGRRRFASAGVTELESHRMS